MRLAGTIAFFLFFSGMLCAAPGDTTIVRTHERAHWSWYGSIDQWGVFPAAQIEHRKILLYYTLGCPGAGCSDWDYTTQIQIRRRTGAIDSSLTVYYSFKVNGNAIDTFSYKTDTTYSYFFDTITQQTDSTANSPVMVVFSDLIAQPPVPTDTIFVWSADYYEVINDSAGVPVDSMYISADSTLIQQSLNVYSPFDVIENVELARYMTPYGGNLTSTWSQTWVYDVTDFESLLHDSVEIRAFYSGWSDGFTITLDFLFIEGTPVREPLSIQNIYEGYYEFGIATNPIENHLVPKKVLLPAGNTAKVRFTASGHSFGGAENCAEFCSKYYYLKINGTHAGSNPVWRNDCGLNALYPQPGTWLYDRSNWCPGERTHTLMHDVTSFVSLGDSTDFDVDFDSYSYTGGAGFNPAYYISSQVVTYGQWNAVNDAGIEDIIAPNSRFTYNRFNPVCGSPKIIVRNNGSATLQSVNIHYGIEGDALSLYEWTGAILPADSLHITLPPMNYRPGSCGKFIAYTDQPNQTQDEYTADDTLRSVFEDVKEYGNDIVVYFKANLFPNENRWVMYNADGEIVAERSSTTAGALYRDTLFLEDGCYTYVMYDSDGDGLSFWADDDGAGQLRFYQLGGGIIKVFTGDFGRETRHSFHVGSYNSTGTIESSHDIQVFPVPFAEEIHITADFVLNGEARIFNIHGQVVYSERISNSAHAALNVSLPSGIYFLRFSDGAKQVWKKVVRQ
ncbi:MAG: T9SS type A sorting domain-containing protein [Bacteroidetes bacterium]|nr:T9SS type A sorting domain-containing protein [Bacteroidota bacterium]MBU1718651.1 T9SS type A sorting domain-containing protein [Bacteroidota bacterium]